MIYGPPEQTVSSNSALNTSTEGIYKLIDSHGGKLPADGLPLFVDVRDCAKAHVVALTKDSVIGKRVLFSAGSYTNYEVRSLRRCILLLMLMYLWSSSLSSSLRRNALNSNRAFLPLLEKSPIPIPSPESIHPSLRMNLASTLSHSRNLC